MPELEFETEAHPLIAVTMKAECYGDWVRQGGGKPRLVVPQMRNPLDAISGLLLTGGGDVDPALYGEANRCSTRVDPERDKFELDLVREALDRNLPILGVCRGMQLLAVEFGGSLYQDLSERVSNSGDYETVCHRGPEHSDTSHPVEIEPDSLLAGSIDKQTVFVNSHHHQGIRELPAALAVAARSRDGLIEAVEHNKRRNVVGLQWHPERWPDKLSDSIITRFIAASSYYCLE